MPSMGKEAKRIRPGDFRRMKGMFLGVLLVVAATWTVDLAWRAGWTDRLENWYYDAWHQWSGVRYAPEHVVLVVVDDRTRMEHRDEPLVFWGPYFARAIKVARDAGAKVIGVDYLFSVSAESWLKRLRLPESSESRTYDAALREQFASGGVILAANMVGDGSGRTEVVLPLRDYWSILPGALDDVSVVNFYSDGDGFVRRFVPILSDSGGDTWATMGQLLAERAAGWEPSGGNAPLRYIGYVGPPGSIPRISFERLLARGAESDPEILRLKDKAVIIASDFTGQPDRVFTPYSRSFTPEAGRMMAGAEVHANIVESLLSNRIPHPVSPAFRMTYLAAVLALGTALFFRLSPVQGLAACLFLAVCSAAPSFFLFRHFLILPAACPQLGLASTYLGALALRVAMGERERARTRRIFGRYVSEDVVEKLLDSGRQPDLGGDAMQVTVLFSDIRDFTTISELLHPREVVEMLNTYFSRACEPILDAGGSVDKFIGDAVMAVFGSPAPHPDHALRAVRAALAMSAAASEFSAWMETRFPDRQLPPFRIGIGLHTGEAIVGNIGSPRRMEFTSIGDTVNAASRLEGKTKELKWAIVASRAAVEAAGPQVVTGRCEEIFVKGRKEAITVFEVLDIKIRTDLSGKENTR